MSLMAHASRLAQAVDGIDWSATQVEGAINGIHAASAGASTLELNEALQVLVDRLRRFDVAAGDGTAHLTITCGSLVERGADPGILAEAMLEVLPPVLAAARECADACLADLDLGTAPGPVDDGDVLTEVDGRPISVELFRKHLQQDRCRAALAYLDQWTLPTVAALTRSRPHLARAVEDPVLVAAAEQLRRSPAHWLRILFGVQLGAPWIVLAPVQGLGFEVDVDGVVSNYALHALTAAALVPRGVEGEAESPEVIAFLEGHGPLPQTRSVRGTWNLYGYPAAAHDLSHPQSVPTEVWAWGEGIPNDIPLLDGKRVLLVGPSAIQRTWNVRRVFSALPASVTVTRELTPQEVTALLAEARAQVGS